MCASVPLGLEKGPGFLGRVEVVVHVAHEFAQYPGKLAVFGCADMSAAINPQELDLEACRVCPQT
jgi:hypothetical protein